MEIAVKARVAKSPLGQALLLVKDASLGDSGDPGVTKHCSRGSLRHNHSLSEKHQVSLLRTFLTRIQTEHQQTLGVGIRKLILSHVNQTASIGALPQAFALQCLNLL